MGPGGGFKLMFEQRSTVSSSRLLLLLVGQIRFCRAAGVLKATLQVTRSLLDEGALHTVGHASLLVTFMGQQRCG